MGEIVQTSKCEVKERPEVVRLFEKETNEGVFLLEYLTQETAHKFITELINLISECRSEIYDFSTNFLDFFVLLALLESD